MIRFGILGVGRHGARYARHIRAGDVPGADVRRVWRRDAERGRAFADDIGAVYSPSPDALIEDPEVDAVIMTVPSGLHAELAGAVARAKKPLLLEKPLARTADEGRAIIEAFETAPAPLTVAQTLRFDPLIDAGCIVARDLGPLVGFGFEQRLQPRGVAWEEDPALAGGGVLAQSAIHAVDAVRFMTEPRQIEVVDALLARRHYAVHEDVALLHLALTGCPAAGDHAVIGDVRASKIGASRHHHFALFLEEGGVELDFVERRLVLTRGRERVARAVNERPTVAAVTAAFVGFLRGERNNPVEPRDALASLLVIDAAYAAASGVRATT